MEKLTGFAEACYDNNTVEDLTAIAIAAKGGFVDETDCKNWNITPDEWLAAICLAVRAKESEI